jgi:hypothetical protein
MNFVPKKFRGKDSYWFSVIPRKKVLIPRHSEIYGRVNIEARYVTEWKNFFTRILLQQTELRACFRPRNASERNSESILLFLLDGTEFRVVFSSVEWFGTEFRVSFDFLFHGTEPNFKLLRSPRIDSKEPITPGCIAWRAGTTTLFLFGS